MPSRAALVGVILVLLFVVGVLFGLLNKKPPEPEWVDAADVPFLELETLVLETQTPLVIPSETPAPAASATIEEETPAPTARPVRTARAGAGATSWPTPDLTVETPTGTPVETPDDSSPLPEETDEPPATVRATAAPALDGGVAITRVLHGESGNATEVRIELTGDVPEYRVFRVRNPARVIVDFEETGVAPGVDVAAGGTALVKEVSARYITNAAGTAPIGRVQILLGDVGDKLPSVSESSEGNALVITIRNPAP